MASAKAFKLDAAVPARQGGAAVRRRRRGMRPAGTRAPMRTTCRSARSPPASRRNVEYQGTVNATANASGSRWRAARRRSARRPRRRGDPAQARQRPHRCHQLRLRLRHAEGRAGHSERRAAARRRAARPDRRPPARRSQFQRTSWIRRMRGQLQMATGELGFLTLYFPGDRSRQRPLRCQPELRRHARRRRLPAASSSSPAPSSISTSSISRCARSRWKRASSPTISSSAPRRKAGAGTLASSGKIEWRDRPSLRRNPASTAKTCAWSTCPRRASMRRRISISASPARDIFVKGEVKTTAGAHRSPPTSPTPCCRPPTR